MGFGEQPVHLGLVAMEERDANDVSHGNVDEAKRLRAVERTAYDVEFRHVFDTGQREEEHPFQCEEYMRLRGVLSMSGYLERATRAFETDEKFPV